MRCSQFCPLTSGIDAHHLQTQRVYGFSYGLYHCPGSLYPWVLYLLREGQGAGALCGLGGEVEGGVCV